jgi:hypothetical protein
MDITYYEAPHYVIFFILLSLPFLTANLIISEKNMEMSFQNVWITNITFTTGMFPFNSPVCLCV